MLPYEATVRSAADVPVFMSPLVQCPLIAASLEMGQKIVVLTLNEEAVGPLAKSIVQQCQYDRRHLYFFYLCFIKMMHSVLSALPQIMKKEFYKSYKFDGFSTLSTAEMHHGQALQVPSRWGAVCPSGFEHCCTGAGRYCKRRTC
jgi:hypothetical protein